MTIGGLVGFIASVCVAGCACQSDTTVDRIFDAGVPLVPDGGYGLQQCSSMCGLNISVTRCERVDETTVRCHFDNPCN